MNLDALVLRTSLEATRGLAAAAADVSRLRLGLEGSYALALGAGGRLTPTVELPCATTAGTRRPASASTSAAACAGPPRRLGWRRRSAVMGCWCTRPASPTGGVAGSLSYDPDPASDSACRWPSPPPGAGPRPAGAHALHSPAHHGRPDRGRRPRRSRRPADRRGRLRPAAVRRRGRRHPLPRAGSGRRQPATIASATASPSPPPQAAASPSASRAPATRPRLAPTRSTPSPCKALEAGDNDKRPARCRGGDETSADGAFELDSGDRCPTRSRCDPRR